MSIIEVNSNNKQQLEEQFGSLGGCRCICYKWYSIPSYDTDKSFQAVLKLEALPENKEQEEVVEKALDYQVSKYLNEMS